MNLKKGLLLANKYTPNPQYFSCASPEVPILQRESLVFLEDIGEGCFGKVYKGFYHFHVYHYFIYFIIIYILSKYRENVF